MQIAQRAPLPPALTLKESILPWTYSLPALPWGPCPSMMDTIAFGGQVKHEM